MLVSIVGAILMTPLSNKYGKRKMFIYSLLISGAVISLLIFCDSTAVVAIFTIGLLSELIGAFFSSLFFVMLGDAADYSEWKNNRRATGLIYSAGSTATKFGGGIAGAIIGLILGAFHYNGQDASYYRRSHSWYKNANELGAWYCCCNWCRHNAVLSSNKEKNE